VRNLTARRARRLDALIPGACLGALAGLLLWTRLTGLADSFWRDEIISVVHYSSHGPHGIWLGHYEPNDHVLFNFLAWATTSVVGHSEVDYRLWSMVPAIAAVVLIGVWLWRSWSRWLAVAFTALAVTSPMALDLGKQARGYGLGFLAGAVLLVSAVSLARGGGRRSLAALGAAGLVGSWTLTGFVIAYAGEAASLMASRRLRRGIAAVTVLVAAGTVAFYGPLLGAIFNSTNDFKSAGQPLRWDAFLLGPPDQLFGPTIHELLHIQSTTVSRLLCLGLAAAGGAQLWRAGERLVLLALAGPLVFTEVALTVSRVYVNPRFVSFLLFHLLLLVALGAVALAHAGASLVRARSPVLIAALALLALLAVRVVQLNDHWIAVPFENFKQVAQMVHRAGLRDAVTDSLKPLDLQYYLGARHVRVLPPEQLETLFCQDRRPLAYVDHLVSAEVKYAGNPVRPMPVSVSCLRARGARLVSVPERKHFLPVNVWLLCAPAVAVVAAACGGSSSPAVSAVQLTLTSAPKALVTACGAHKPYAQYAARQPIAVAGTVTPNPGGNWHAKLKLKRCAGSEFREFSKSRATTGTNGSFGATLGTLPAGYYVLRAEVTTLSGRIRSGKMYFHVAS
jgi:hypothetical protein